MDAGSDRRLPWWEVPVHVRRAVEGRLGAAVIDARTQEGGFSPGAAARLRLANGGAAFVKALSEELHALSMELYRMEAAAPSPGLDPWLRRYLERLAQQDIDTTELVRGDALLHGDMRSDNILITPDWRAVVVDWAWACNGAPWLDLVCLAMSVNAEGGADAEALVRDHPLTSGVAPSGIDAILLAVGLNYRRLSRTPDGGWRRAFADATLGWLRRRLAEGTR